jgi:hypothetical protein
VGSFTAAAGAVIYDGGACRRNTTATSFTTEPTINVVHHTRLKPEGSSYSQLPSAGREQTEFIRSTDMWWRPIEVRVGADGCDVRRRFLQPGVAHNDTRGTDHNKVTTPRCVPIAITISGSICEVELKQLRATCGP